MVGGGGLCAAGTACVVGESLGDAQVVCGLGAACWHCMQRPARAKLNSSALGNVKNNRQTLQSSCLTVMSGKKELRDSWFCSVLYVHRWKGSMKTYRAQIQCWHALLSK